MRGKKRVLINANLIRLTIGSFKRKNKNEKNNSVADNSFIV